MRRALLTALLLSLWATLSAQAQSQRWVPKQVAELQTLDKVTARVGVLRAPLNEPITFGTLTITVRACHARPADEVADAAAWLEITDSRQPSGSTPAFRGWVFAEAPGVNAMEHPVYDVRLLACR